MRLLLSLLLSASWVGLSLAAPGDGKRKSHTVTETGWDFQQEVQSADDVEILYTLEAYECDERYKHVIFPTYEQGDLTRICIKLIDDQAIADGFSLVDLASVYYQKEHWTQYAIEDGQPDFFGFSDFDCYPERQLCWLETKLWDEFFDTEGFVHLTGLGTLQSGDATTLGSIQVGFPITANIEPPVWLQDSKERITSVEALVLFVISFFCVALAWMVRPWRKTSTSNTVVAVASENYTDHMDAPIQESIAIPNGNNTEHSLHTRGTTKTLLMNGDTIETEGDLLERGTRTLLRRGGCVGSETDQPPPLLQEEPVCLDRGTTNQEQQQSKQHRRRKHRSKDRSRGTSKSDSRRREALLKRGKKSISTRQFGRKDNGESPPSVPKRKRMKKKRSQRARSEHKDKINNNSNSTNMTMSMTELNSYHSSPQPPVRKKERRGRRKSRRNCIVLISDGESDVSSLYFNHHIPSCRSEPLPRRKRRRRKSRRNCIVHVKDTDSVVSSLY